MTTCTESENDASESNQGTSGTSSNDADGEAPESPDDAITSKRCIHCDTEISIKATTCPECQKLQSRWKQTAVFGTSGVGLVTGLLALSLVIFQFFGDLFKQLTVGDQLDIISLRTQGEAVAVNRGYRDIALLRVDMQIEHLGCSGVFPIGEVISPNAVKVVEVGDIIIEHYGIANGDDNDWNDYMDCSAGLFCGAMVVHDAEYLHTKKQLGSNLTTYQCEMSLVTLPAGENREVATKLDCVGLIFYDKSILSADTYEQICSKRQPTP